MLSNWPPIIFRSEKARVQPALPLSIEKCGLNVNILYVTGIVPDLGEKERNANAPGEYVQELLWAERTKGFGR